MSSNTKKPISVNGEDTGYTIDQLRNVYNKFGKAMNTEKGFVHIYRDGQIIGHIHVGREFMHQFILPTGSFRKIPGFLAYVSKSGIVLNDFGKVAHVGWNKSRLVVNLHKEIGGNRIISLIRAVAMAWNPEYFDDCRVVAKNGDRFDCRADNTLCVSESEAGLHIAKTSKMRPARLDESAVRKIKSSITNETTYAECRVIGEKYGVTGQAIHAIKKGITWKHVK